MPDIPALCRLITRQQGWDLRQARFYSGVPAARDDSRLHAAWATRLRRMRAQGVVVTVRALRRHRKRVWLDDGTKVEGAVFEEKGIDVRIAPDIVRTVFDGSCDVVLLFSQDQDFVEVATEVRAIAGRERRWVKMASAFPVGEGTTNRRGVDRTDWIPFERHTYEACLPQGR